MFVESLFGSRAEAACQQPGGFMLRSFVHCVAVAVVFCVGLVHVAGAAETLSFNKDIRAILVENCFGCHGADSAGRKADLRLDDRDAAVESGAIVPGDPDSSVALDRIFSDDPEEVMPPPSIKKVLTPQQKELIKQWIAEGAEYQPHWSFIPPKRPEPPAVKALPPIATPPAPAIEPTVSAPPSWSVAPEATVTSEELPIRSAALVASVPAFTFDAPE
jgi:hypothetical protein